MARPIVPDWLAEYDRARNTVAAAEARVTALGLESVFEVTINAVAAGDYATATRYLDRINEAMDTLTRGAASQSGPVCGAGCA